MPEEEKVYTSMYSRNAELYHHGILGMKWGLRNGPPYPLGSDVSTGSRLKKIFSRNKGGEEVKKTEEEKAQIANAKAIKKEQKKQVKELKRETLTSKAIRDAKGMTNEELKQAYDRLKIETLYAKASKEVAELSVKKPTLAKKMASYIKKTSQEQASRLVDKVLNNLTDQLGNKINNAINDEIKEREKKKSNSKKDNKKEEHNDEESDDEKPKETSKASKIFNEYKEYYKEGWNGDNWYKDPETKEPKMNRKEREAAAEVKRTAEYKDAVAESLRQMYDDPNYEQYKETIFRQYAQALGSSDKYRKENQETIDKLDRQYPNYKYKKKK